MPMKVIIRNLLLLAFLVIPTVVCAQTNLIGQWQSQKIQEGTEELTIEFSFKDSVHMEMAFVTDNQVPQVGRLVSRIAVLGSYLFLGPLCFLQIEKESISVEIIKIKLNSGAGTISENEKEKLKEYILKKVGPLFDSFSNTMMIYVSKENDENAFSFIIGNEENAMNLEFTRKK